MNSGQFLAITNILKHYQMDLDTLCMLRAYLELRIEVEEEKLQYANPSKN